MTALTPLPLTTGEGGYFNSSRRQLHRIGDGLVLGHLIEVQVAVDFRALGPDLAHVAHVLGEGRDLAEQRADCRQFRRAQVHIGALAETVGEVAGRG